MATNDPSTRSAWAVLITAILLTLAVLVILATSAHGGQHRISWNLAPAQVNVGFKVVKLVDGSDPITLGETTGSSLVVDVSPGDLISIIATSPYFDDAPPSDPFEIPPDPIDPGAFGPNVVKVTLRRNPTLAPPDDPSWKGVATFYFDNDTKEFFDLKIETP